ncbi:hypothetical protein Tco_1420432 [Tanacetum coccineum]
MAQTDMLERFKNLQDDYNRLADAHAECSDTVWKLVTARQDLEHNVILYTNAINRYKNLKEKHAGCEQKVKTLEEERNDLSVVNRDQASQIKELEAEVARKDSALADAEQIHEYKKSLSKPFNMVIQAGWGKGLSEGHTDNEMMAILHKAENFDAYSDKKLYPMYDKLFEKEYLYVEKISSGYRHSVFDLLKVHPLPTPSEGTLAPTISKALGGSSLHPN